MLCFSFRRAALCGAFVCSALLGATLVGCTVTPDSFPPCVNPYVDTCPVGDAAADAEDGGPATDATTPADAADLSQ